MTLYEASFNGVLRDIVLLLIAWWILRLFLRARSRGAARPQAEPQRPQGEVRIERATRQGARDGDIVDAEFEEIS